MKYTAVINGIEVNYLLLDTDGRRELSPYADYTISLKADLKLSV